MAVSLILERSLDELERLLEKDDVTNEELNHATREITTNIVSALHGCSLKYLKNLYDSRARGLFIRAMAKIQDTHYIECILKRVEILGTFVETGRVKLSRTSKQHIRENFKNDPKTAEEFITFADRPSSCMAHT